MKREMLILAAALGLVALGVPEGARAAVTAADAVIRPAPRGIPSTAAYLTLNNRGARPERLVAATCDCAAEVTPHESMGDGGVMRMRPAGAVAIPAHGSVNFKPGGLHLMVMGLKRTIGPGETVTMTLRFDHAGPLKVRFAAAR